MNTIVLRQLTNSPICRSAVTAFLVVSCFSGSGLYGLAALEAQTKPKTPTITLVTKPNPPTTGSNLFTVVVKSPEGQPVVGADVVIELVMPAMPSMNMPEMRNKIALKADTEPKLAAAGTYTGTGPIMMSGPWTATVSVKVGGKDYAETKLTLTAK